MRRSFLSRGISACSAEELKQRKIAVTLGIGYSELLPFIKAGLPVVPLPYPKEGLYTTGGNGHLMVIKNPPHPNAAKVFANWLLGRDGQEILAGAWASAAGVSTSTRNGSDVRRDRVEGLTLTVEESYRLENQSEEKVYKLRELGAAAARRLLGS